MKKIVYFDENSATDFLIIKNGGALVLNDSEENKSGDKAEVNVGAKLKLLFNSLFVSSSVKVDSNIGVYTSGENLIKTTITNTTLSDFLEIIEDDHEGDYETLHSYAAKSMAIVANNTEGYYWKIRAYRTTSNLDKANSLQETAQKCIPDEEYQYLVKRLDSRDDVDPDYIF